MPTTQKKIGICFGGGAGLFPYYMGINKYILEHYDISNVVFVGCSAGSVAAVSLCIGTKHAEFNDLLIQSLDDIRRLNVSQGSLFQDGIVGKEGLSNLKAHLGRIIEASGKFGEVQEKCTIVATRLEDMCAQTEYINNWNTPDDLVECIAASCFIPFVFGDLSTKYRGVDYIDGGALQSKLNIDDTRDWIHITLYTFKRFNENPFQAAINLAALLFSANQNLASYLIRLGYDDAMNNKAFFEKKLEAKKK